MKKISLMMSIMILSLALLCFSGCKENLAQPTTDYNFSVSDYSITIEIGQTHKLEATYGTYEIEYVSTDINIVTVDEKGLVKAISEGVAYINILANNKSESCKVIVEKPSYSINLNKKQAVVLLGSEITLVATCERNGEYLADSSVLWEASSTDATLNIEGKKAVFIAKKEGFYTVTVSDERGNQATFTAKVMKKEATMLESPVLKVDGRTVSWEEVDGATEYYVGFGDGEFEKINSTSFLVEGDSSAKVYVYASAENSFDYFSSNVVMISVG